MLQSLAQDAGYSVQPYSGRGMYGKKCLGVVVKQGKELGNFIGDILEELSRAEYTDPLQYTNALVQLSEDFQNLRQDNLGISTIIYFPNVSFDQTKYYMDEEDE